MSGSSLIDALRSMCRLGDFRGLDRLAADTAGLTFEEGLWLVRCFLEQGHPLRARPLIGSLDSRVRSNWDRIRLDMHRPLLDFLAGQDLPDAEKRSAQLLDQAREELVEPARLAEIEGMACRLRLMGASIYANALDDTLDRLDRAAGIVLASDAELAARMMIWRLSALPDAAVRWTAAEADAGRLDGTSASHRRADLWLIVADKALEAANETASVHRAIERAATVLGGANSGVNAVDLAFARARLRHLDGEDAVDEMEACLAGYRRLHHFSRLIAAHAKLARIYGERAQAAATEWHRHENTRLIEETGFGVRLAADILDLIGREREGGNPAGALELCQDELAKDGPEISRVTLLHARALCRSALGHAKDAVDDMDIAAARARACGAEAFASEIDFDRATLRYQLEDREVFPEADRILADTAAADLRAGRLALGTRKLLERSSLRYAWAVRVNRASPPRDLLREALSLQGPALEQTKALPLLLARRSELAARQLEGQVRLAMGDRDGARDATARAMALARSLQSRMIEAGCLFMPALERLNDLKAAVRARDVAAVRSIGTEVDELLARAQALYEQAGVMDMAARAVLYRAEMFADAALVPELSDHAGLDEGFRRLHEAAVEIQERRRQDVLGDDPVRRMAAMRRTTSDYVRLDGVMARYLLLQRQDREGFWAWMRRTKARSFLDWVAPARTHQVARAPNGRGDPASQEIAEIDRILRGPDLPDPARRGELFERRLAARRATRTSAGEATAGRTARTDVEMARGWLARQDRPVVLVDWVAVAGHLYLSVLDARAGLRIVDLDIPEAGLLAQVSATMDPGSVCGQLLGDPDLLEDFAALVGPLADLTEPDDLLVLSPTRSLWSLPIHALQCGEAPLIVRNPVSYAPSIPLLIHQQHRPFGRGGAAAVFGDPTGDSAVSAATAHRLAALLRTVAVIGGDATKRAFLEALSTCTVVHFQGHAKHRPDDPLTSAVHFAVGESLTAEEILNAPGATPDLVVLAGCESGIARVDAGDDHEGLTTTLVLNGVRRVVSTLWSVNDQSCAAAMTGFYERVYEHSMAPVDALRASVVDLMRRPECRSPYHWAPYVFTGDWR